MKFLPLFFCLLIAVNARAANPAFSDFNLNQFGTNATAGNKVQIKSGSLQSNNVFWSSSSAIQMKGSDGTVGASFNTGTNFFAMVLREDKSLIVSSNTLANLPTLLKGDMAFWSSNGVPHLITCAPNGTLATNALLASGSFTGDANQFTTSGTTHISDGAIVSNVVDYVTLKVTNAAAGGYMTISNISVSYHNSSDVLGDFIFFDSGLAILGNGAIHAGGGYMSVSNGTTTGITLLGGSNIFQVLGIAGDKLFEVASNEVVTVKSNLNVGNNLNVAGTGTFQGSGPSVFNGGITNHGKFDQFDLQTNYAALNLQGLTASRMLFGDAGKTVTSAAASGAVPINADGTASTFAQINTLAPGNVVTQGFSLTLTLSNNATVDAAHTLTANGGIVASGSNFVGYAVAQGYGATTNLSTMAANMTNSVAMIQTNATFLWLSPINMDATGKDYQACTVFLTNSAASGITMTLPTGWSYSVGSTNGVNAGGINKVVWERYVGCCSNVTSVQWR